MLQQLCRAFFDWVIWICETELVVVYMTSILLVIVEFPLPFQPATVNCSEIPHLIHQGWTAYYIVDSI